MNNYTDLDIIIAKLIERLDSLDPASDEYGDIMNELKTLYELRTEALKERHENEKNLRDHRRAEEEGRQKNVNDKLGIILPIALCGAAVLMGFNFEKTGMITSQTFRKIFDRSLRIK